MESSARRLGRRTSPAGFVSASSAHPGCSLQRAFNCCVQQHRHHGAFFTRHQNSWHPRFGWPRLRMWPVPSRLLAALQLGKIAYHHCPARPQRNRCRWLPAPRRAMLTDNSRDKAARWCFWCWSTPPPRQGSGLQNVYHTVTCTVRKPFAALPRVNRLHPHDKSRQKRNKGDPIVWVHAWKFPGFGAPPAPNSAAYAAKDRCSQRILDVAREIAAAQVVVLQ